MKKYLLTLSMVVLFGIHLVYQRFGFLNQVPVAAPGIPNSAAGNLNVGTSNTAAGSAPPATNTVSSRGTKVASGTPVAGAFKDGSYVGTRIDAYYGYVQVQAIIRNGKLADIQFLEYPNDQRESIEINTRAMPQLRSEAIAAQSANVDTVSRATDSTAAFRESLASALAQAKS